MRKPVLSNREICSESQKLINIPPEIARRMPGWRNRRKERLIMKTICRATTPQTGFDIFQKLKGTLGSLTGEECCTLMLDLADAGYLKVVGHDDDAGWQFEMRE